jgi:hypothetical protein
MRLECSTALLSLRVTASTCVHWKCCQQRRCDHLHQCALPSPSSPHGRSIAKAPQTGCECRCADGRRRRSVRCDRRAGQQRRVGAGRTRVPGALPQWLRRAALALTLTRAVPGPQGEWPERAAAAFSAAHAATGVWPAAVHVRNAVLPRALDVLTQPRLWCAYSQRVHLVHVAADWTRAERIGVRVACAHGCAGTSSPNAAVKRRT